MTTLRPLLPSDQQWIDPRTGRPTQVFFDYLRVLDLTLRGAWTPYSASLAAGSGAFASASVTAASVAIGRTVLCRGVITIPAAGSALGAIVVGLPTTTKAPAVGSGFESQATNLGLVMRAASGAGTATILKVDGTTIIADGCTVEFTFPYEPA